jgi:hypothetical protein
VKRSTFVAGVSLIAWVLRDRAAADSVVVPRVEVTAGAAATAFSTSAAARFSLAVTNRSNAPVVIALGSNGFALDVRTTGGSEARPYAPAAGARPLPKDVVLRPGATFSLDDAKLADWGYSLGPGSYSLAAVVRIGTRSGRRERTWTIRSRSVAFDVWGWRDNAGF